MHNPNSPQIANDSPTNLQHYNCTKRTDIAYCPITGARIPPQQNHNNNNGHTQDSNPPPEYTVYTAPKFPTTNSNTLSQHLEITRQVQADQFMALLKTETE